MKVYRCLICGETYLGEEAPDKCPFCGVARAYLVLANCWINENIDLDLTDTSRKNLESALDLEVGNSRFYLCAAGKEKDNPELEGMFKRLSKVEREHASIHTKILNVATPKEIDQPLECPESGLGNIQESNQRETNAVEHYQKFLSEATETRIKKVFSALIAVEKTHLELDELELNKLSTE